MSHSERQDPTKRYGQVFKYSTAKAENLLPEKSEKNEQHYRLRHLNTGRLIIDQEIEYQGIKIRTIGLSPHLVIKSLVDRFSEKNFDKEGLVLKSLDELENFSNFEIENIENCDSTPIDYEDLDRRSRFRIFSTSPSLDTRIVRNSCVQIQHVMTDMYITYKEETVFNSKMPVLAAKKIESELNVSDLTGRESQFKSKRELNASKGEMEQLYCEVDDDDIQTGSRDAVELKPGRTNDDAFFIIPEDDEIIKNLLFIQTAVDQL